MTTKSRSLELFFIDGRPDGLLTAEMFNWTGHVLRIPRTQLQTALARAQAFFTGVYILIGENDGAPMAYIDEAENLSARLRDHAAKKEWWDSAILITTTTDTLHKAHVKYLESRLVEIALAVGTMPLDNGNIPARSSLSEADQANMESFLETLHIVLPAIRIDIFLDKSRPDKSIDQGQSHASNAPMFELQTPRHGIVAKAQLIDGEIIVQAGSIARLTWIEKTLKKNHYFKLHAELLENGVLKSDGTHAVFTKNYAFSSLSAAAAVLNGRPSNGRFDWKFVDDGRTYGEWEQDQLNTSDSKQ